MLIDGLLTCTYMVLPEIVEKIQQFLVEKEINIEDCLALTYDNSVFSALVLLYLLETGYSFRLLPKESKAYQGVDARQFLPKFPNCFYKP